MTRKEYLDELQKLISSLPEERQTKLIEYYGDYFDEINDDEKILKEFGKPEFLADKILEKEKQLVTVNHEESGTDNDSTQINKSLGFYYSFETEKVKNLVLKFGACEVVIISGEKFEVETRGIKKECFNCHLSSDGTLTVNNTKQIRKNFWHNNHISRNIPRILITLPVDVKLEKFNLFLGAGKVSSKDISVYFKKGDFRVEAGSLSLKNAYGGNATVKCGMGNFSYSGSVTDEINVECGMGSIKMNLEGNASEYSFDAKVGIGDFIFNEEKQNGVCKIVADERKSNHFNIKVGMGKVRINM